MAGNKQKGGGWLNTRAFPRKNWPKEIAFTCDQKPFKGRIRDISARGVFIEINEVFNLGQTILLTIPQPENDIKIEGKIVRIDADGIGVEFSAARNQ